MLPRLLLPVILLSMLIPAGPQSDRPVRFPTFPNFTCDSKMAYCNRTAEAGLKTVKRYGRGSAFVDVNGDGWDDIFFADTDDGWDRQNQGWSMFFINRKDGTFEPKTAGELGIDNRDLIATWNGSFADYDNDGDADLLLASGGYTGKSNLALYRNRIAEGFGFISATNPSGIGLLNATPSEWWGSSWADYDRDGFLDVIVTRLNGTPVIFHNNGNGTFKEVAASLGVDIVMKDGKNPVWLDHDMDGDPDLYIAGLNQHAFYRNDGGSKFTDITREIFPDVLPLPEVWPYGPIPIVFSAAAADFNQDGLDDLYLGRWSLQQVVLINDGRGKFKRHTTDWGLVTSLDDTSETTAYENTMGLSVGDLFDDGYPDIYIGTGQPSRAAPDLVFCNRNGDTFYRCTDRILTGADQVWRTRGHGTVFSDFDHDGDTDFVINLGGHPDYDAVEGRISPEWPALYVNVRATTAKTATLTLVGTVSNRDAVGARIRVNASGTRYYVIRSMQGFQSQNSRTTVVSLGPSTTAEVEIRWPSGRVQSLSVKAGDRITVNEPE
jgi:ASPIC and UnbV/FG-GAP-like repeat